MDVVVDYPFNVLAHDDRVTRYALAVVRGELDRAVGKTEKLCCERHLKDLERQGTEDFPYIWNPEHAHVMIDFAETLILAEGAGAQPLRLWGFQDFILGSWHGWKDIEGYRRFKTSYVQIGRQNGKSVKNAIPSMYYGNFDGYMYPQIYAAATKADQAWIVAKECVKFISSDPELGGTEYEVGMFTIREYNKKILCNITNGEIVALGRDTKTIDGFRPYYASVDEYHLHPTDQMFKLLLDGARNLHEYLISVITTAGFDLNGPCYEEYEFSKSILEGVVDLESRFVYIAEPDKELMKTKDGPFTLIAQQMANPLWTPQKEKNLADAATEAREKGGTALRNYLTKGLNWWVQFTDNQYMNMDHWKVCGSDTTIEDMTGRECYLGFDLSSGGDLTSGALEFPLDDIGDSRKYYIHSHSFIPKNRVAEHVKTDNAPYDMWITDGLLTPTETLGGVKTDYKYIVSYYRDLIAKYNLKLKGIAYDPHNADAFLSDLEEFGVDCVEIVQSARSLNDATVDFRLECEARNVIYDRKNKLLTWSMRNAKTVSNSFGEIKVDKDPNAKTKRIDPVDAVIDVHKLTLAKVGRQKKSVYEERGLRRL